MKRLHILMIKSYIGPFILTFFVAMFILLMQFLWKYIDDLVGKGLEWYTILELLMYASAGLVQMALPLAVLMASIMTFGNLGENNELMAMKSSGISLQRIMKPLSGIAALTAVFAFLFFNYVTPYTNLQTTALLYDIKQQRPTLHFKEGTFNNDIDGYVIKIGKKDNNKNLLYNFMLYDHTDMRGNTNVTIADSARMVVTEDKKNLILTMYNGCTYEEVTENKKKHRINRPHRRTKFKEQQVIFTLEGFDFKRSDFDWIKKDYRAKNLIQLSNSIDSLDSVLFVKKDKFAQNLIVSNYFKSDYRFSKRDKLKQNKEADTGKSAVNIDSIWQAESRNFKIRILEMALHNAKMAQSYIVSTEQEFYVKTKNIRKHEVEWHTKFTFAFACLILFFIGAPLGAIIRKGGLGLPVVISVMFFILYYIITISGKKLVTEDILPANIGMWISSVVLLPLGVFLTYKATHDSVILNIETYLNFFRRFFDLNVIRKNNSQ